MYTFSIRHTDHEMSPGSNLVVIQDWKDIYNMAFVFRQRWFDEKGFMKAIKYGDSLPGYAYFSLDDNLAMCVLMNSGGYVPTWNEAERNEYLGYRFHNLLAAAVPIWGDLDKSCIKRDDAYEIVSTNAFFWQEVKRWVNHYWRLLNDYHNNCFKTPANKESFMQLLEDIYRPESP